MSTPSRPGVPPTDARPSEQGSPAQNSDTARPTAPPWQRGGGATASNGGGRGSGAVDAPTTQMQRPELPADMPDLSATPRTGGGAAPRSETTTARSAAAGRTSSSEQRTGSVRTERRTSASAPENRVQSSRKGPRRASLQVKHVDPWSVLKLSLVLSVALFLVWMVAIGVLYLVLDGMGVWDRLNTTFTDFVSVNDPNAHSSPLIGPGRVFGVAAIVGAVNIVLMTALATISSFIYNLTSDLVGGVEVTLTERD